jgi:hypothetical protein
MISEAVTAVPELLRHILIKLTKNEEAHPFYFHEALEETAVEVNEEAAVVEPAEDTKEKPEAEKDGEAEGEKV